ncbi:hypothetical protein [Celeribacter sp. ULVN23_4]
MSRWKLGAAAAVVFALGIVAGRGLERWIYEDACLDLGGGRNPTGYPVCVIEK